MKNNSFIKMCAITIKLFLSRKKEVGGLVSNISTKASMSKIPQLRNIILVILVAKIILQVKGICIKNLNLVLNLNFHLVSDQFQFVYLSRFSVICCHRKSRFVKSDYMKPRNCAICGKKQTAS